MTIPMPTTVLSLISARTAAVSPIDPKLIFPASDIDGPLPRLCRVPQRSPIWGKRIESMGIAPRMKNPSEIGQRSSVMPALYPTGRIAEYIQGAQSDAVLFGGTRGRRQWRQA